MASEVITKNDLTAILDKVIPLKPPVHIEIVFAEISRAFAGNVKVTAPSVDGYQFLCWAQVATNGWVGSVYPATPNTAACDMWNATSGQSGTGSIRCLALYIPA